MRTASDQTKTHTSDAVTKTVTPIRNTRTWAKRSTIVPAASASSDALAIHYNRTIGADKSRPIAGKAIVVAVPSRVITRIRESAR